MPTNRPSRAARKQDVEETLKRAAPENDPMQTAANQAGAVPALPDLTGAPVPPEARLSLQQSIGNSAVGSLVARRRAGQALPPTVRHDMEASFGENFGQVQIHSGPEVDQAAESLAAGAFTVGSEIFVHSDARDFETPVGRQVLGEELAHVAQGVGREGASRVTAPGETAERDAQRAGRAAAAGRPAAVAAAPEAAGAVARFGLKDIEDEAKKLLGVAGKAPDGEAKAKTADAGVAVAAEKSAARTGLSDEEKDRLRSGGLEPLMFLHAELMSKLAGAAGGAPSVEQLLPITDNSATIPKFIYSFAGPPEIQAALEEAAESTAAGRNAILASMRPQDTLKATTEAIGATATEIGALAVAQPPAAPTPAAPGAAEPPAPESLTAAESEQLKAGAVDPLLEITTQLRTEKPDLGLLIGRMAGIPGILRSFSKPAALVPQLHRKAMSVEIQMRTLQAVAGGSLAAITEAAGSWQTAIVILLGITVKSTAGGIGAPAAGASAAASDDDGQNKPN